MLINYVSDIKPKDLFNDDAVVYVKFPDFCNGGTKY